MKIGFDLLSDLNISPEDNFDWANKATSLYCLVAGNVSSDVKTVALFLNHLSNFYQGVFYIPGTLEYNTATNFTQRTAQLVALCKKIKNVAMLHHHVVIIDGVAVLGCTGWYGKEEEYNFEETYGINRFEDLVYLKNSIEKLQKHLDVKKILLMTNAVPDEKLHFGQNKKNTEKLPDLTLALLADSESKISHWAYGSNEKITDTVLNKINYISNPYMANSPYWAKRIDVEI